MSGVLVGFGVVLIIAGIGWLVAHLLPDQAEPMRQGLVPAVYYVLNPALMILLMSRTDLASVVTVFSPLALLTAALAGALYAVASRFFLHRSASATAVGAMSASYANAGNIGVPIALYAVGTTTPVVAVLLAQLLVLAPTYLVVFSLVTRGATAPADRPPLARTIRGSIANPVTIATAVGAVLSLTDVALPEVLGKPIEMLGNASVPVLLLVFGMSLAGQRPLTARAHLPDVAVATAIKVVVMPVVAWALGTRVFGLDGTALLGAVVMAALPTAQNVFLFSHRFRMPTEAARDVIVATSFLAFPAVLLITVLLH